MNINDLETQTDTYPKKTQLRTTFKLTFFNFSKVYLLLDFCLVYMILVYVFSKMFYYLDFYVTFLIMNFVFFLFTVKQWYIKRRVSNILQIFVVAFRSFLCLLIIFSIIVMTIIEVYNCIVSICCIDYENQYILILIQSIFSLFSISFATFYFFYFNDQECNLSDEIKIRCFLNNLNIIFLVNVVVFLNFYAEFEVYSMFLISLFILVIIDVLIPILLLT
ncbi:hypothetical protein TUBRATIS_11110 [Tubulinosema ratisbonensis]|uniref:Transmembrane protein n=1 Tax=Tubulinosema ratisbonensis TaxID=291195 RepID=A0A437AMY5_9MICR|nr:hypothetical protein TUBRATIS_11110 [Tubulinosema ratisbonensis]